jgi:hypothetical protein
MKLTVAVLILPVVLLCACATKKAQVNSDYHPPTGTYRLIVVEPDVTAGELTAGGVFDQREDWTEQARSNIVAALQRNQGAHGGEVKIAATPEETGWDPAALQDLVLLHRQVGSAIEIYKYGTPLPTKLNRFDWTLGEQAVAFGTATHYDYALFMRAQDSFASGGRRAAQAFGMLGCIIGVCVAVPGGSQIAFASLVDLKTGAVVWFNRTISATGDIRTPDGAGTLVDELLSTMNSTPSAPVSGH